MTNFLEMTAAEFRSYIKNEGNRFNIAQKVTGTNKFNAKKTKVGERTFDSKKESQRFIELQAMLKAGLIVSLECQKRFELIPAFEYHGIKYRNTSWISDFYYQRSDGQWVAEDCKSPATRTRPEYILKKKLFMTNPKYKDILFNEFL